MKINIQSNIKAIILGLVIAVGASYAAAGTFTPPACPPPNCNADAPINVGISNQYKLGGLALGTSSTQWLGSANLQLNVNGTIMANGAAFNGPIAIADGTEKAGRVLVSTDSGFASWKDIASVPGATSVTHGAQLITNPGSGVFTVPSNVSQIKVTTQAGGGGTGYFGNYGGAGGYCVKYWTVNSGDNINYSVGDAGGVRGGNPSSPTPAGGNSIFNSSQISFGGVGGGNYDQGSVDGTGGSFSGCTYGIQPVGVSAPVKLGLYGNASKPGYILIEW